MAAIIGSRSEDFYVSENEEKCILVASIPSIIVPGGTKTVCTYVYCDLKYLRPHKFLVPPPE